MTPPLPLPRTSKLQERLGLVVRPYLATNACPPKTFPESFQAGGLTTKDPTPRVTRRLCRRSPVFRFSFKSRRRCHHHHRTVQIPLVVSAITNYALFGMLVTTYQQAIRFARWKHNVKAGIAALEALRHLPGAMHMAKLPTRASKKIKKTR